MEYPLGLGILSGSWVVESTDFALTLSYHSWALGSFLDHLYLGVYWKHV